MKKIKLKDKIEDILFDNMDAEAAVDTTTIVEQLLALFRQEIEKILDDNTDLKFKTFDADGVASDLNRK